MSKLTASAKVMRVETYISGGKPETVVYYDTPVGSIGSFPKKRTNGHFTFEGHPGVAETPKAGDTVHFLLSSFDPSYYETRIDQLSKKARELEATNKSLVGDKKTRLKRAVYRLGYAMYAQHFRTREGRTAIGGKGLIRDLMFDKWEELRTKLHKEYGVMW